LRKLISGEVTSITREKFDVHKTAIPAEEQGVQLTQSDLMHPRPSLASADYDKARQRNVNSSFRLLSQKNRLHNDLTAKIGMIRPVFKSAT
jgi:hypothetical protein